MKKAIILVVVIVTGMFLLNNTDDIIKSTTVLDVNYVNPTIETVSFFSTCDGIITEAKNGVYKALVYVSEKDIPSIKENSIVKISGAALGEKEYNGYISYISDTATSITNSGLLKTVLECIITINNGDSTLKQGYNITAEISTLKVENALIVDYDAVLNDGKNYWVYLINNNQAKKQYIEVFKESENGYIVQSGVNEQDKVILCPSENVLEFKRVNATIKGE